MANCGFWRKIQVTCDMYRTCLMSQAADAWVYVITVCALTLAEFIFHIFAIFAFFAFLKLRLLGTVVLKYLQVKYSRIYGVSLYTIIVYGSCRSAKFAGPVVGFVWKLYQMESCIRGFHIYKKVWTPFVKERLSCGSVGPRPVKLQGAADQASTYCHFSNAWCHRLARTVYVSIYNDVEIFADGYWSAKTANIKPREN